MFFYNFKKKCLVSHSAFKVCFTYWMVFYISIEIVSCSKDNEGTDVMYDKETDANLEFDVRNSENNCNNILNLISNLKCVFDKYKESFKNDIIIKEAIDSFHEYFCDIENKTKHVLDSCLISLKKIENRIDEIKKNISNEASESKKRTISENSSKVV